MMGGPGSGGCKVAPGDIETHSAWDMIVQDPDSSQKLAQVRCKYCTREMAQHTSRQRAHLLQCTQYLDAMKDARIENSITKQAADPAAFFRNSKVLQSFGEPKPPKILKMTDHSIAVRIQALALAEAHISLERIHEVTGIDAKTVAGLRQLARERGYDPAISMVLKEEYVYDVPGMNRPRGRPRKRRHEDAELDPDLSDLQDSPQMRAPPVFSDPAPNLPPGNWNFMTPVTGYAV